MVDEQSILQVNMLVQRIINKPVDSNSFVLFERGKPNCIVIDPGTFDCFELLDYFKFNNLFPEYIFLTHEHFDHIWGVNKLKDIYQCKIVCSKDCSERIIDNKKNMSVFYNQIGFVTYSADLQIDSNNLSLIWNNLNIECIISKGHSIGSMCIIVDDKLFSGDTIIPGYKTVVKFPGGNKLDLLKSLEKIFKKFNGKNVSVYPGHGNSFFLNEIKIEQLV
jgi:glyoxylase-like metal-dependent hydrolase (beta-lactamase superfamily II)